MDYEKKYKEALERARQIQNTPYTAHWDVMKEVVEYIFPNLAESEDERIKKSLKRVIASFHDCNFPTPEGFTRKELFAWLEKQGEHANFRNKIQIGDKVTRNEDGILVNLSQLNRVAKKDEKQGSEQHSQCKSELENVIKYLINGMRFYYEDNEEATWGTDKWSMPVKHIIEVLEKQREQKPTAWSEEDEVSLVRALAFISNTSLKDVDEIKESVLTWLKSLKDRFSWKPSGEQLYTLEKATHIVGSKYKSCLNSLYSDLKKLREE